MFLYNDMEKIIGNYIVCIVVTTSGSEKQMTHMFITLYWYKSNDGELNEPVELRSLGANIY